MNEKDWKRFDGFVDKNGPIPPHCPKIGNCWIWIGCKDKRGYGRFAYKCRDGKYRPRFAHRLSFFDEFPETPKGKCICHKCDNPRCVRPLHLFAGTHADNVADKVKKGRQQRGINHHAHLHPERMAHGENHYTKRHPEWIVRGIKKPGHKLTNRKVRLVRELFKNGVSPYYLGKIFGICSETVRYAVERKTWKHIC